MSKRKYYSAEALNKEIDKIIDKGFTPKTKFYNVQEGLNTIVIGNELPRAGYIRTYEESIKFIEKKLGQSNYTKEQYKEDLKVLQDRLGGNKTYEGFLRKQRKRLIQILESAGVDWEGLSTKKMYEMVKEAQSRTKEGNYNSPQFYEFIKDMLDE